MDERIVGRIARRAGVPDLAEILAERISASALQSLLLEVFRRRAHKVAPAELLRAYSANRFVRPSAIDATDFARFERLAFSELPDGFRALELSPLGPLATCAAVAPVTQNNVVSATRHTEVVADATNILALECAVRRRVLLAADPRSRQRVRLCASHRHMRGQPFTDPKYTAHFRVFCLSTAGRDEGGLRFEVESLNEHISFHLGLLQRWMEEEKVRLRTEVQITVRREEHRDPMRRQVLEPLASRYPGTPFTLDTDRETAIRYYDGLCFNVRVHDPSNTAYDYLVDGGFTDWTRKLLANRKERLLTSGIGSELLCKVTRAVGAGSDSPR